MILARTFWPNTIQKHPMPSEPGVSHLGPESTVADSASNSDADSNLDHASELSGDADSLRRPIPEPGETPSTPVDQDQPVSVGSQVPLIIHDVAFGGEGVGRCAEFVIFVPFVLRGEEVLVEVTEVKKRFARARLIEVLKPSPDRVKPECRYFGQCGGCQYQHMAYERQLEVKHQQVASLIERIGGFVPDLVTQVIPCPTPYGYRNRIMIRTQWDKTEQRLKVGFLMNESRLVVDLDHCAIADPDINRRIPAVRANPPPRGGIKVVLRVPPEGWVLPNDSFFQNNFHLLPKLVETVAEALRTSATKFLVDAYCGVGFFSLELSALVERFVGVELDLPAIRAARANALKRQIHNGEFVAGRTEDLLPSLFAQLDPTQSSIILDPPRTGCVPEVLNAIASHKISQIIYVSCHPATLARDLRTLCDSGGYRLHRVTPLDMFPQTQHVECVAVLRLPMPAAPG